MRRAELWMHKGILTVCATAFAYLALCGLDYGDPVQYRVMEVRTPVVRQGENLRVFLAFRRLRLCSLDRVRIIIDGSDVWHEVKREHLPASGLVGEEEKLEVHVPIGLDFAPGQAAYRAILAYECPLVFGPFTVPNLFHQVTPKIVVVPDLPFTILPRGEGR